MSDLVGNPDDQLSHDAAHMILIFILPRSDVTSFIFNASDELTCVIIEPPQSAYAKTKTQISFAVTAKLISAFVFATRIVQFLFYLNPKFQDSNYFLCLYRPVCVRPVRKPHCWFSHGPAHIAAHMRSYTFLLFVC